MLEVSIAYDEHLNAISEFAELVYFRILPHTDDFGRFSGNPIVIKARTMPMRENRAAEHIAEAIYELIQIGLLKVYLGDDKLVLQFGEDSFRRINAVLVKNNKGNSEYPEPTTWLDVKDYKRHVVATCLTRAIKSKEYKVESKKQKEESGNAFEIFWEQYGKKRGKPNTLRLWNKLTQLEKEAIFVNLPLYVKSTPDVTYRKDPERYLRHRVWEDEIIKEKESGKFGTSNKGNQNRAVGDGFDPASDTEYTYKNFK